MAYAAINQPFSPDGTDAKAKFLLLGSLGVSSNPLNRACSLHIEHVSPDSLLNREISRTPRANPGSEAATLALLRRWFFARKPDAGFVLTDFPATLLQARVFDEWLDARGEEIDAVVAGLGAPGPVVEHYRTLGLLSEGAGAAR